MCGSVNTVNTSSVNEGSLPQVNLVSLRCLFVCLSVCACVYVCVCVCVCVHHQGMFRECIHWCVFVLSCCKRQELSGRSTLGQGQDFSYVLFLYI
jgi:hypothetical protein